MTAQQQDVLASRLAWLLLASAPTAMAVSTWYLGAEPAPHAVVVNRFFAPAVLVVELAVIVLAMWRRLVGQATDVAVPLAPMFAVAGMIVLAGATTFLVAVDTGMALVRLAMLILHCAFAVALAFLAARAGARGMAGPALAIGGLVYALICAAYVLSVDWRSHDWGRFGLGVVNVRHIGFYLVVGIAGSVAAALRPGSARRTLWVLIAVFTSAVLAWSGSRGGVLALVAGAVLTAAALGGRVWRIAAAMPAVLAIGALLSFSVGAPHPAYGLIRIWRSIEPGTPDAVSSGRLQMWRGTIGQIAERPLVGHGESQFFMTPAGLDMYHHPHQSVLQLLHQWGVTGLLLALALAAWLWPAIRRAARREPAAAPLFLLVNVLIVYSLYDGILFFVYPAMMLTGLCGALVGVGVARARADRYLPDDERGRPDLPQRTA